MTTGTAPDRSNTLRQRVEPLAVAARRRQLRCWWLDQVGRWIAVLGLLVLIDILWPLPALVRVAGIGLLAVWAIRATGSAVWPRHDLWRRCLREAAKLDADGGDGEDMIVNALWLERAAGGGTDDRLTAGLTARTIKTAHQRMSEVCGKYHGRRNSNWTAWGRVAAMASIGLVLLAILLPGMTTRLFDRFVFPDDGDAPIGLTLISATWDPSPSVEHGSDVHVTASVRGRAEAVNGAWLVELDSAGRPMRRWRMCPADARTFTHRLRRLQEPITFRIDAAGTQSPRYRIELIERTVTGSAVRISDPVDDQLRQLATRIANLAAAAAGMIREAGADSPAVAMLIEQLDAAMTDFARLAGARSLSLSGAPKPGRSGPGASDDKQAARLDGIATRARADVAMLAGIGRAVAAAPPPDEPAPLPEPAGGVYHGAWAEREADRIDAATRRDDLAPASYRPLVNRYFHKIAYDRLRAKATP